MKATLKSKPPDDDQAPLYPTTLFGAAKRSAAKTKKKQLTISEIAKACGHDCTTVSQVFEGKCSDISTLRDVAAVFGFRAHLILVPMEMES